MEDSDINSFFFFFNVILSFCVYIIHDQIDPDGKNSNHIVCVFEINENKKQGSWLGFNLTNP